MVSEPDWHNNPLDQDESLMPKYRVETRATVRRVRWVRAKNPKDAETKSVDVPPEIEEDENEETMAIAEEEG